MALFNRSRRNQSVLPEEVSQYYQSQRRERTGVAIVLGIVALVVTLLIGAALFFGGRYVYRQLKGDDKPATTQQADSDNNSESGEAGNGGEAGSPGTSAPGPSGSGSNPAPAPSPAPAPAPAPAPSTPQRTVPNTGDEPALPRTGDEGM